MLCLLGHLDQRTARLYTAPARITHTLGLGAIHTNDALDHDPAHTRPHVIQWHGCGHAWPQPWRGDHRWRHVLAHTMVEAEHFAAQPAMVAAVAEPRELDSALRHHALGCHVVGYPCDALQGDGIVVVTSSSVSTTTCTASTGTTTGLVLGFGAQHSFTLIHSVGYEGLELVALHHGGVAALASSYYLHILPAHETRRATAASSQSHTTLAAAATHALLALGLLGVLLGVLLLGCT